MKIISTRDKSTATTLSDAIAAGLASDGGLYVPQTLPKFDWKDFDDDKTLIDVTIRLLTPFFADDELASELPAICREALDIPAPLHRLATPDDYVLELFHGPTAAFKDFGARFLAACMRRLRRDAKTALTILVATSGDTGAAVGAAFDGVPNIDVCILYPDGRVSPRQAHQLGCCGDNVRALRIAGSFDDCQAMVKQALSDGDLQKITPLSSANSISLGRLLPQMSYYAFASLEHWRAHHTMLNFVVPTGNLGNAFACALARACGLPIGRIALATNANLTLHDFFGGGEYRPRASIATHANAMDVGAPSNFERLRWLIPDDAQLRREFTMDAIGDAAIEDTIRTRFAQHREVFCPHTATAVRTLEALRQEGAYGAWAIVATAHPAKFERIVEPLIGGTVPIPPALTALLSRPSSAQPMPVDYLALRSQLVGIRTKTASTLG